VYRKVATSQGCHFLKSGRVVFNEDSTLNYTHYAEDGLHLSNDGILSLGYYLEGNIGCLLDKNKKVKTKKLKIKKKQ
jgi:hypothetical protein